MLDDFISSNFRDYYKAISKWIKELTSNDVRKKRRRLKLNLYWER